MAYPRLSPVVMMRITRSHEILLARAPRFAPGVYSVLAGFVEPGETLEQALKSEQVARGMAIGGLRPAFETGEPFANRITRDRAIFADVIRRTGAGVN